MTATAEVRQINPSRAGISPWRAFPAKPEDWFGPEEIAKAKQYTRPLKRVRVVHVVLNVAVNLIVIGTHLVPNLLDRLDLHNWVFDVFVASGVLIVIGIAQDTGFDWWRSMVYDKQWGFSTMTVGTFFGDLAKSVGLGLVLNGLIFVALWAVIRATDWWWLVGWAVFAFLQVGLALVAPRFIEPLFNKFTRIPDDELHADIVAVAHSVGANIDKVEMSDASKRDVRKNAYVAGAGKTRRMVVFDTMLEWPRAEVRWVCAHEIGHWRRRHIARIIPIVLALLLVDFAVLKLVLDNESVLDFAGVTSVRDPGVIPLFLFVLTLPGLVTGLIGAYFQRAHERDADLFGLEAVPDPASAMAAMRKLHTESLADLTPSLWRRLNNSHPPVAERLAMIKEWGERQTRS